MPILLSLESQLMVIDEDKNILWEWPIEADQIRLFGLSIDPETGNLYVGGVEEVFELTRTGSIVWRYRHPKIKDLHSVTLTPTGNLLLACAATDRVLEVNKKKGVVWEWWVGDHHKIPEGSEIVDYMMKLEGWGHDWTHLNYARKFVNGDTLISLPRGPNLDVRDPDFYGEVLKVNNRGKVIWRWGEGELKSPHWVAPYKNGYLIADREHRRLIHKSGEEIRELTHYGITSVDIKPGGNLLLGIPGSYAHGIVLEISPEGEELWRYDAEKGRVYVPIYLPEWNVKYTSEEKAIIIKRLRALGYLNVGAEK